MVGTNCKAIVLGIWGRFLPNDYGVCKTEVRIIGIPNKGMNTMLGDTTIKSIPAHFLHSDGNFQFYDITHKVLFSGDLGASLVHHHVAAKPIAD
jgi:flavorubredoxin